MNLKVFYRGVKLINNEVIKGDSNILVAYISNQKPKPENASRLRHQNLRATNHSQLGFPKYGKHLSHIQWNNSLALLPPFHPAAVGGAVLTTPRMVLPSSN